VIRAKPTTMRFLSFALIATFLALGGPAFAQGDPPPSAPPPSDPQAAPPPPPAPTVPPKKEEEDKPQDHSVAVLISPFHLILPVVEITAEIRLHERIGVAVIGGIGSIDPYQFSQTKPPAGVKTGRFTVWEAGAQFVSYPVGHFDHGMQLGAELLYLGIAGSAESATNSASGTGQGLSMGPFIGYKFTAKVGFSLAIQGGVAYVTARADAKDAQGNTASRTDSQFGPLINLNLGWAF
jgi:hypothetical protein